MYHKVVYIFVYLHTVDMRKYNEKLNYLLLDCFYINCFCFQSLSYYNMFAIVGFLIISITQANLCLLDIDRGSIEVPEDLPQLPNKTEIHKELLQYFENFASQVNAKYDRLLFIFYLIRKDKLVKVYTED